ncbi:FAD binding domain protein [Fusarium sp. NRRL 25303]|nr:FAD binding domain protein [Fusarium sp. NRRL 25303]
MQGSSAFKVIIVGAGVTGLTLAHCLAKAGIDFVLLDKGVVAPSFGTTITLQPHGCRILHQLGFLDGVLAKCDTMGGAHCRDPTSKSFASNDFFGVVRKLTLDRQVFLRQLYELLPDKSQVYEKARVEQIVEENSVARVILADGLREIMWDKANALYPGMITVDEKRAMVTQYNAIVMASSPVPGIGAHDMEITSNDKYSFLLLCQPDWISIIVHSKLPEDQQCTWPTRRRYTEADMQALVTPNSALGGNTAMEDAVVIANTLHALLAKHPNKKPSDVELHDNMRQEYQDTRVERARAIVKAGGALTRQQAYDGWKAYIIQRWLTPIIGLDILAQRIAGLCVTTPKLNFVEFEDRRGILGWQDTIEAEKGYEMKGKVAKKKKKKTGMFWNNWNGGFEAIFPHIIAILAAIWSVIWLFPLSVSGDHVFGFGRDRSGSV